MRKVVLLLLWLLGPVTASAIEVFACEPEWGALVTELAADNAKITVATTAFQDPHRLQAKPSLLAAIRSADLLVCTGADLEIGWLPLLLRRAGKPNIRPGGQGYFLAADFVRKLEIPVQIDRSQGDIHPQGNPHVHLHPRNIERIAKALGKRLVELDPANASAYDTALQDFLARWADATAAWEERALPLAGLRLVSHHRSFSYLADWLDLDIVATLEPKPGIPASGAHLGRLLGQLSTQPPVAVIGTQYTNEKAALWLAKRLDITAMNLPYTTGGADTATDLFGLFETTLSMLEEVNQ